MIQKIRKFFSIYKRERDGSAAVEFSLIAVPFLLAVFGIMEAGRIMWTVNSLQYAVEETGRQITINADLTDDEIAAMVAEKLQLTLIDPADLNVTSARTTVEGIDFIEINADYDMPTLLSFLTADSIGAFAIESTIRTPLAD